ncbi:MAG: ATP-binding protein [bacterium]|nr:ATP-binding protein [bacterium]
MTATNTASLAIQLRSLRLPSFVDHYESVVLKAERDGIGFTDCLRHLVEVELCDREARKIDRLRKKSQLPLEKTLTNLDQGRLPRKLRQQLPSLCSGGFVNRAENALVFGMPDRGKSTTVSAIGHELIGQGKSVLWRPASHLVQKLLIAKMDLNLEAELRRLDRFDVVILDDIGYVQQNREEMEVLFTFLAERYERRSVMITSNLVFSQWAHIFKGAMTTAAAIDHLVHHSVILELTGENYRTGAAMVRKQDETTDQGEQGPSSVWFSVRPP